MNCNTFYSELCSISVLGEFQIDIHINSAMHSEIHKIAFCFCSCQHSKGLLKCFRKNMIYGTSLEVPGMVPWCMLSSIKAFVRKHGYAIVIRCSDKDKRIVFKCDRCGGLIRFQVSNVIKDQFSTPYPIVLDIFYHIFP